MGSTNWCDDRQRLEISHVVPPCLWALKQRTLTLLARQHKAEGRPILSRNKDFIMGFRKKKKKKKTLTESPSAAVQILLNKRTIEER